MFEIDDRHAHFLGVVGDLCIAAELGGLEVEMLTGDGQRLRGIPAPLRSAADDDWGHEAVPAGTVLLDDQVVKLGNVVACTIYGISGPCRRSHPGPISS